MSDNQTPTTNNKPVTISSRVLHALLALFSVARRRKEAEATQLDSIFIHDGQVFASERTILSRASLVEEPQVINETKDKEDSKNPSFSVAYAYLKGFVKTVGKIYDRIRLTPNENGTAVSLEHGNIATSVSRSTSDAEETEYKVNGFKKLFKEIEDHKEKGSLLYVGISKYMLKIFYNQCYKADDFIVIGIPLVPVVRFDEETKETTVRGFYGSVPKTEVDMVAYHVVSAQGNPYVDGIFMSRQTKGIEDLHTSDSTCNPGFTIVLGSEKHEVAE